MILENQIIFIEKVKQLKAFELQLEFNDKSIQVIDFYPFLSSSSNPFIKKYLSPQEFSRFEVDEGDLEWNDYDLCFPIADLYQNKIIN